jgi:hypothetical protein
VPQGGCISSTDIHTFFLEPRTKGYFFSLEWSRLHPSQGVYELHSECISFIGKPPFFFFFLVLTCLPFPLLPPFCGDFPGPGRLPGEVLGSCLWCDCWQPRATFLSYLIIVRRSEAKAVLGANPLLPETQADSHKPLCCSPR